MYDGLGLTQILDEDADDDLQYDESEIMRHFLEFYYDVLPELEKHGRILQFRVCRNYAAHLRGNVYVQFENFECAWSALSSFKGRFYASKQLTPEFSPVTNWKSAICGLYDRNECPKGKECNFLHVFKNPHGEYTHYNTSKTRMPSRLEEGKRNWNERDNHRDFQREYSRDSQRSSYDRHHEDDREYYEDRDRDYYDSRERRRDRHYDDDRDHDRRHHRSHRSRRESPGEERHHSKRSHRRDKEQDEDSHKKPKVEKEETTTEPLKEVQSLPQSSIETV